MYIHTHTNVYIRTFVFFGRVLLNLTLSKRTPARNFFMAWSWFSRFSIASAFGNGCTEDGNKFITIVTRKKKNQINVSSGRSFFRWYTHVWCCGCPKTRRSWLFPIPDGAGPMLWSICENNTTVLKSIIDIRSRARPTKTSAIFICPRPPCAPGAAAIKLY